MDRKHQVGREAGRWAAASTTSALTRCKSGQNGQVVSNAHGWDLSELRLMKSFVVRKGSAIYCIG